MSDWDVSDLNRFAFDLGKGNAATVVGARKVIEVAAVKIKKGMQADATGHRHAPAFPASITYDLNGLEATVGPDKDRPQGALGNILYFGTAKNAPVIADIAGPLNAEAPVVERLLGELAARNLL